MARTFYAKFPGKCPECPNPIEQGAEVMYSADNKVIHAECQDDLADLKRPTAMICLKCNLQKPCDCEGATFQRAASPQTDVEAFFADVKPVRIETLEEQVEQSVERDRWDRPIIVQRDGSKEPYNRASSFGGQIEDDSNISRWKTQQVVRGMAMHPELADIVPAVAKGDPWAELDKKTKTGLTRIADQAQEYAGSNLKSALGTQIHAATEFVDLGDSLEDKFADLDPARRKLLIERGNAYHRAVTEWGLKFDSVETFIVNDTVKAAGTYDRRGFVPWWPGHSQTIIDVKTSSSLDFAGIGFAVQLSVYAFGEVYDIPTAERTPHEDMNPDLGLIIHVDRNEGGHVTLAKVNIAEGWKHARLAREIIVARREGKKWVSELDVREAQLLTASTKEELFDMAPEVKTWPSWLIELAKKQWGRLPE